MSLLQFCFWFFFKKKSLIDTDGKLFLSPCLMSRRSGLWAAHVTTAAINMQVLFLYAPKLEIAGRV